MRLSKNDALGTLIEKFLEPEINLSPNPVLNGDGSVKHPGMDNHSMGTAFEELVVERLRRTEPFAQGLEDAPSWSAECE